MNRFLATAGRVGLIFCVVTTATLAIFIVTLASGGFLSAERVDTAVRALRGEAPASVPAPVAAVPAPDARNGSLRELETLVTLAEARERDLRQQADRIRAEKRTAEKASAEKPAAPAGGNAAPGGPSTTPSFPQDDHFKANLDVLRNHVPKTAAALMADWETADIVAYLRAMKPFEAADILGALLAMGKKGEIDYAKKAKDVQAAIGKQ